MKPAAGSWLVNAQLIGLLLYRAIFPYQALERRAAQETLIGCAGLCD
jgi:hypothetical protein